MSEQNQSQEQTQNAPKKKWYKKWWVITLGIVVFLMIISNSGDDKSDKKTNQEQEKTVSQNEAGTKKDEKTAEPAKSTPQVTVTSVNISKEYSENEVAADEKYKGKLIQISGKVSSIDNGTFDNEIIVKLSDGQYDFSGAMCYMKDSEKEKVLAFKKGQQVTLVGTGNSATLKSPVLKDCVVK